MYNYRNYHCSKKTYGKIQILKGEAGMINDVVRITKRGFILEKIDDDEPYGIKQIPITDETIMFCLRYECIIEDGVTLRHLMQNVAYIEDLCSFIDKYSHAFISDFNKMLEIQSVEQDKEIEFLQLSRYVIIYPYQHDDSFHFCGIGHNDKGEEINWMIFGDYIDKIIDKPIILNENVEVVTVDVDETPSEVICKYESSFSLFDVLNEIYWEISFHGSPEETAEFRESLASHSREIEDGEARTIPFEEIKRKLTLYFETRKKIEELVESGELMMDTWEEIWEYISSQLDFNLKPEEDEMAEYRKAWMQQELDIINREVNKGEVSVSLIQRIKSIFEEGE